MFEKIGRKLVKGAKAEISESPDAIIDWDKITKAAIRVAEIGLFVAAIFWPSNSKRLVRTQTVITNNYYFYGGKK